MLLDRRHGKVGDLGIRDDQRLLDRIGKVAQASAEDDRGIRGVRPTLPDEIGRGVHTLERVRERSRDRRVALLHRYSPRRGIDTAASAAEISASWRSTNTRNCAR